MALGAQISKYRELAGWTLENLAERSGVDVGTLSALENRNSTRSKFAIQIAQAFGMTVEMLADEEANHDVETLLKSPMPPNAFVVRKGKRTEVCVVGKGAGGVMPERIWSDGDYPVGATGEVADVHSGDPEAFVFEVEGTSMVSRYNPGEFALVEPNTPVDIEDDVLVRLTSGQTMLKRLVSRRSGITLSSYNDPEVLHYTDDQVTWMYYVVYPVPRKKIKTRV